MVNRAIAAVVTTVAIMWLFSSFLGTQLFALSTILLAAFTYLLLAKLNVLPKILQAPIAPKMLTPALAVIGIVLFLMGGFGVISPILTPEGIGATLTGSVSVPGTTITGTVPGTSVQACSVTDELRGKTATVTINAYDFAANNPYSSAVDTQLYVQKNGGDIISVTDTTAGSFTSYSVGDKLSIKGGNGSYYVSDQETCIISQQMPLEIEAYAVAAVGNMEVSCYDDTGSASCTAATNNTQADFDIVLAASQEKTYYLKVEVATANVAFNLYGQALVATNDIKEVDLLGPTSGDTSGWSKAVVPDFLSTTQISEDDTATAANITGGYDTLYLRDEGPMLMTEFDSAKYKYKIVASATDPAATTTFASTDNAIVCFLDAVWSRGKDGKLYLDVHDHGDTESNVGMIEDVDIPVTAGTTADICVVLAGE